jgi:fatty aldehyde-generating acyl-ACP reductase
MEKFAFIIHALDTRDVARKYPVARFLPDSWVERLLRLIPPKVVSHITGVRSQTGAEAEGWFIGCPMTSRMLVEGDQSRAIQTIVRCGEIAQALGAGIVGLGAFTSVVGDAGLSVAEQLEIAVTTGNTYTVATALDGAIQAAALMETDVHSAHAAVVGAGGSIGRVCARLLAPQVGRMTIVDRNVEALGELREQIAAESDVQVASDSDVAAGIRDADIIVTVTSAVTPIIEPEMLKSGAVVCDVARPRDVSRRVAEARDDVLVIEGGVVAVPGEVDFHFDFGFPPKTAYACMSETMILALEGRYESYTLGRELAIERVHEMNRLAAKHGFRLAGFRSFERAVTDEEIERIKGNVRR